MSWPKKFKAETFSSLINIRNVSKSTKSYRKSNIKKKSESDFTNKNALAHSEVNKSSTARLTLCETVEDRDVKDTIYDHSTFDNTENGAAISLNQEENSNEDSILIMEDGTVCSFEESSVDESETDMVQEVTISSDSEDSFNEECHLEEGKKQSCDSSSQEITRFTLGRGNTHVQEQQMLIAEKSKSAHSRTYSAKTLQNKRPRMSDKTLELPVPAHINQYGECMKTRLGRHHYGLTLSDPPGDFFQGVLKGASGQTLAVMFGDVNLFSKFESVSLEDIGHFIIDTAFNVTPNGTEGVNKVFTISLILQNVVIPLWYAITSCSSAELYKRILIEFQQHVLDWPFTSVLMNNDPALSKALQTVFPDVDCYGSWFYYCYSIWKEVNRNNLQEECKVENSTLLMAVKLLMVVPYMPPPSVENSSSVSMVDGFQYVRDFTKENSLPNGFNRVLDYVAVFWFNKVTPENFTVFGKHRDTLNYVEILQLLLLSYMKENANVWDLTRSFQCMARSTFADFIRILNGKRLVAKKNRGKRFNAPIRQNMKRLMGGIFDVKTFLERSTVYLEEMLDIFLHPLYPTTTLEKTNYIHTEGWAVKIISDKSD